MNHRSLSGKLHLVCFFLLILNVKHCDGVLWSGWSVLKNHEALEGANLFEGGRYLAHIHLYCLGAERVAWHLDLAQRFEVSQRILEPWWLCKTWRHERQQDCEERTAVHVDGHAVLRVAWGVERLTLWQQVGHLELGLRSIWICNSETSVSRRGHGWTVQKSHKRNLPQNSNTL